MAPSATVNVVRYSALAFGIFYGIVHRRSLQSDHDRSQYLSEVRKREEWVEQAKREWRARQQLLSSSGSNSAVTDPDSPLFDLESFLNQLATNP